MKCVKSLLCAGIFIMLPLSVGANNVIEDSADMFDKNVDYIEAANYLAGEGILVDRRAEPAKYNVNSNILRQEIAGTVAKIANVPDKGKCDNLFADVKITADNSWACPRIESLLDAGIIARNQNYRPLLYVSKAEALGFIVPALYKDEYADFKDPNTKWEENAINFAKHKAILREDISNYNETASRGFIFRIMYYAKLDKFLDTLDLREIFGEEFENIENLEGFQEL